MRALLPILLLISASALAQEKANRQMQDTLKEVTIRSQSVQRVLHSAREYVVDYDFVDGYILVASYSSPNRKDPKLFLLAKNGDTASLVHLPEEPAELYQSCSGRWYCLTEDLMYPLHVDTGNLLITEAYTLSVYEGIKNCKYATNDMFYYKFPDYFRFKVTYAAAQRGDMTLHEILSFDDRRSRIAKESEAKFPLSPGAAYLLGRNAFAYVDQPLFWESDKVTAFDFRHKRIVQYDLQGKVLDSVSFHVDFSNVQRMEIIKDPVTNEYYLHRSDNPAQQTLSRINMQTGEVYAAISIEKPFIAKLKVFNGEIYYLFQNPAEPSTQQLYVQRGF